MNTVPSTCLALMLACLPAGIAAAQQDPPPKLPDDFSRVFHLEHADALSVTKAIERVVRNTRIGFDQRTNTVIVVGTPHNVSLAGQLIGEIDRPVDPTSGLTSVIPIDRQSSEKKIRRLVGTVAPTTSVVIDAHAGAVVVRGPAAEIEELRRVISILADGASNLGRRDRPATPSYRLSFYFLGGSFSAEPAAAPTLTASEDAALLAQLDRRVSITADREPLATVIQMLAKGDGVNLVVDRQAFAASDEQLDRPISLELVAPTPLRAVIKRILAQLSDDEEWGYWLDDNLIVITDAETAAAHTVTRVYDVGDLVEPADAAPAAEPPHGPTAGPASRSDDLRHAIMLAVTPDDWIENDGEFASLNLVGTQLIAKHTAIAQQQIADLLGRLRGQRQAAIVTQALPADLAPVAAALADAGIYRPALLAPLSIQVQHNEKFEVSARSAGLGDPLRIQAHGRLVRAEGNTAHLEIDVELARIISGLGGGRVSRVFEMESTVVAPIGDYVVVAATPGTTEYGEAVVVALRITTAD